jgi:hypothetical protein
MQAAPLCIQLHKVSVIDRDLPVPPNGRARFYLPKLCSPSRIAYSRAADLPPKLPNLFAMLEARYALSQLA